MDTPTFRERLALRLAGFPLLRTLVLDPAFLAVFAAAVLCAVGLGIGAPKIWQTTPEPFSKARIRVSLIDLVQAWSLSRTARAQQAAGNLDAAFEAWRAALVNNLGSPELHRGLLAFLKDSPVAASDQSIAAILSASWLMALTATNATDVVLAADVLEKHRVPMAASDWLQHAASTNSGIRAARARNLLALNQGADFQRLWREHRSEWAEEPRMRLYHDAHVAGWETGSASLEAFLRLREATQDEGNGGLEAARLLLRSASRQGSTRDMELALSRLAKGRADAVGEHVLYWRHLASVGRFEEAKTKARNLPYTPRLAQEAAEYSAALAGLGLREAALEYLESALPRFQAHPSVWEVYLSILGDSRRWNEIRAAAAQVRGQTATFETARTLGTFAEYRAEVAEQRRAAADHLADRLADSRVLDNLLALRIANELARDGRSPQAVRLLRSKTTEMRSIPAFWLTLFSAAMKSRDRATLVESSVELLALLPKDPVARSNRAAVLMTLEDKPLDALAMTLSLVLEHPDSLPLRINHAYALVLNQRVDESATLLGSIPLARLDTQAASAFHLTRAEIEYARGNFRAANEAIERVQPGLLLPTEEDRVALLKRELRHRLQP